MKKLLITASLVFALGGLSLAQELKTVNINTTKVASSNLNLSDNWVTQIKDNSVLIYNGRIDNNSANTVKDLKLSLYLFGENADISTENVEGYLVSSVPLKKIEQTSNLVGVNIKSAVKNLPPDGKYKSVLILTDKRDEVVAYKVTKSLVEAKNGEIAVYREQVEVPTMKKPDLEPRVQIDLKEDNAIALEKDWKVDIDFKNFLVNIEGGDIANNTAETFDNIVLDVYLTTENQSKITQSFNGLLIASADLNKIDANKRLIDTAVKTNMRAIPQSGTYHILVTLSSKDANGKTVVRNKRAFYNTISF